MSSFTSELVISPLSDGRKWKLVLPFKYHIGYRYNKNVISVPRGFVTDFASVPWVLWTFLPSWGKYGKAAIIHDYIYQSHVRTRKEADEIFYEAMLVSGTPERKAKIMFWGVRLWGWMAWKKKITKN